MPIVIRHEDARATAQLAQNVGQSNTQRVRFDQSMQLDRQAHNDALLRIQLENMDQEQQQREFNNAMRQQEFSRRLMQGDQNTQYKYDALGQKGDQFGQNLDYRRQALAQRLDELGQKISAGAATREDVQEHQSLMREQQAQDAMSRTQFSQGAQDTRQQAGFDFTSGQHEMDRDLRRTLDESHNRRVEAALQATMGRANSSLQMQQLSKGLASIYSQRRSIDAQADTAWTPQAKRELDYKREQLKQKEQEILSAINQIQPLTPQAPAAPSAPTFQPAPQPNPQSRSGNAGQPYPTDIRAQNQLDLEAATQARAGSATHDAWRGLLSERQRLNMERYGFPVGPADPADEAGFSSFGGMPPSVQGSESGYSVGQLIPTPKGQVRIVGFDQDGMPLVEPA